MWTKPAMVPSLPSPQQTTPLGMPFARHVVYRCSSIGLCLGRILRWRSKFSNVPVAGSL